MESNTNVEHPGAQKYRYASAHFAIARSKYNVRFFHPVIALHSRPYFTLILLTVVAGFIRFYHLAHPCLWYDESMVFWRTCGSYGQLLDCLRTDGFVPLHYSLIWVLSRWFQPTPVMLRFVPAMCGTLMVPAVYLLGRQLFSIGTSLLAAAFTACSAFMLFYSRDAKMYMDAWLFVTLNMACLLWWMRTRQSTAWLCWIASGSTACGLHASAAIPVGISLLFLFTQSTLRWQQFLLWLAGMILIFAGPIGYYEKFNRWEDRVDEAGWKDSGLQWIGAYNAGRTGPQLVRYLATITLMGWEWPTDTDVKSIKPARVDWPVRGATVFLGILAIGCLPWAVIRKFCDIDRRRISSLPHPPQWRIVLWLSFWIVLPVYSFYCRSIPGFASPLQLQNILKPTRLTAILLAIIFTAVIGLVLRFPQLWVGLHRAIKLTIVALILLGLCQAIAITASALAKDAIANGNPWQSLWVPRYMGFIWPALALVVAALVRRLPTLWFQAAAIFFILGINLGTAAYRILGETEPPVDRMAADVIAGKQQSNHTLAWMHIQRGMQYPGGGNLFSGPGEYYVDFLGKISTTPLDFRRAIQQRQRANAGLPATPWQRHLPTDLRQVVIWDQFDFKQPVPPDKLAPTPWKLQEQTWYIARDCWIWQDLFRYRRQVYTRQ